MSIDPISRYCVAVCVAMLLVACQPTPEERLARAEAYVADADYRAAILELKNALQTEPDSGEARLLFAEASYQLGDFATAQSEYERALGLGEDRPDVWLGLGRTLLEQRKAAEALERVLPNLHAANEAELTLKGDVLSLLGNTADADAAYLAAIELHAGSVRGLIGRAVVAASANDLPRARALLDEVVSLNPDSPLAWRALGNFFRTQHDYGGAAIALAKSMAVETPTTPLAGRFETRISRTSALIDGKDFAAASAQLEELNQEFPRHPSLAFIRGRVAFANGDYDLAQSELQQYLARVPRDARGQAVLGAVNFSQDNLRQAEMYLSQAVRANIGGESVRRLLAETQLRLDKPGDALASLQAAQAAGQTDALLLAMMGRAEIGLGDTESAIRHFEQASAADPGNPAIGLSLAASYVQAGRTEDAIRILEPMQDAPGSLYRRATLLIGAYLSAGRRADAIGQGDALLGKYPDDAAAYVIAGVLHKSIGDAERAAALFERALVLDAASLGALYNLGAMAVAAGDTHAAATRFEELLDAHPVYVPGLVSLAAVLQQEGNLATVKPRLAAAIDIAPNAIAPRVLMARVELAEGQAGAALEVIAAARELFPDEAGLDHLEVTARLAAGDAEMNGDSPQAALRHYDAAASREWTRDVAVRLATARQAAGMGNATESLERWLAENPGDAGLRTMYAQLLEANGDMDRAVAEYERVYAAGELNAVGMNNLAWQYFLQGRDDAVILAEKAHDSDPDNGSITDTLGWILFNTGDRERGVSLLREAAGQSPDNAAIRTHLETALAKE